jgi:hypothetical protein
MIQRIQTLWLFLAGVAGLLTYKLPLWSGRLTDDTLRTFTGAESLLLFAVIILACLVGFVAIFLYKNRKTQKSLAFLGMLLSIGIIAMEYFFVEDFKKSLQLKGSTWQFGALMPVIMVILFFLAYQGIRKDEKMIKSLDRLR